ncbi:MAG TPA: UDP-N-acetylmuramoyl-L-alanine--D-glutamate ligase [Burkholderiaceae bacterium]
MKHLRGLSVLVLGLGESGLGMATWCASQGASVRVWDSREAPPQAAALALAAPQARLFGGVLAAAALEDAKLVLKSPGLAPQDERIAALLAAARGRGVAVQGELELFTHALDDLRAEHDYTPRLIAITGTNGKTTTTALTALLVERCGKRVAVAGNIGPTMLDTLAAALEAVTDEGGPAPLPEVWVLELSSFQLDGVRGFEPSAATALNVTQDHLDWHGSLEAYAAAKTRVFGTQGVMVLNRDDPLVEAMLPPPALPTKGRAKAVPRSVLRFGLGAPQAAGDFGLVVENGMAWLVRAMAEEDGLRKRGTVAAPDELYLQRLMPADALRIRGRHNAANALAALALATAIGCPLAPMLHGLREYRGEPHRVAFVATVGGVEAFDDSKGTNVGATVAALQGLGADKSPAKLVVILGGDGKGQDFTPLAAPVAQHARAVALIGRDAAIIEAALADTGVSMQRHATLESATAWCFEQAREGDAVLLSPACASLDMFRNYGHRAEVFVAAVQACAALRGELA